MIICDPHAEVNLNCMKRFFEIYDRNSHKLLARKQYSIYEYKFVKCLKKTELPKKFFRNEEKLIRRITASNVISACLVFSRKIK